MISGISASDFFGHRPSAIIFDFENFFNFFLRQNFGEPPWTSGSFRLIQDWLPNFGFLVGKEPKRGILLYPCRMLKHTSDLRNLRYFHPSISGRYMELLESIKYVFHYNSYFHQYLRQLPYQPPSIRDAPYPALRQNPFGPEHLSRALGSNLRCSGSCSAACINFYVLYLIRSSSLLIVSIVFYCSYCLIPYFLTYIGLLRIYYKVCLVSSCTSVCLLTLFPAFTLSTSESSLPSAMLGLQLSSPEVLH